MDSSSTTHEIAIPQADALLQKIAPESSESLHRLILNTISSFVILIDSNGTILEWNRATQDIFSLDSQRVIGMPFDALPIEWDINMLTTSIDTAFSNRQPLRLDRIDYKLLDGRKGVLGLTLIPLSQQNGECLGCIIQGAEITDRIRLEAQLAHSQKMESIGQLAAGIAHEINTPTQYIGDNLNFLQESFAELGQLPQAYEDLFTELMGELTPEATEKLSALKDDLDLEYLDEEIPKALNQSLQGVDQVAHIVRAMKQLSYPDTLEKTMADINAAVQNAATVTRNEWKYVAEMELALDPDLPKVPCLLGDFNQVILNLIVNASHAIGASLEEKTQQKGAIKITSSSTPEWVELRITDNGTGIPKDIQDRIFDPFFTTKELGKGTGQGLAIAFSVIVEKHQGTLTFDSEPGSGTTFIIRLPRTAAETQNAE